MPRPLATTGYPLIYTKLIEKVLESKKEVHHECATHEEALSLRFSFYAFLKALRKSPFEKEIALGDAAASIMFCIEDNVLILKSRDQTEVALSLEYTLARLEADLAQEKAAEEKNVESMPSPSPTSEGNEDQHENLLAKLGYSGKKKVTKNNDSDTGAAK